MATSNSPIPVRGRVTVPSRKVNPGREFMFNPDGWKQSGQTHFGSTSIAGASHPVFQFGSGGEDVLSFNLYLDGDRGVLGRGKKANVEGNNPLDITPEIRWWQALRFPAKYGGTDITEVFPGIALLTYGVMYQGVTCIVPSVGVDISYLVPDPMRGNQLMPVRATLALQFKIIVGKSKTADDILAGR